MKKVKVLMGRNKELKEDEEEKVLNTQDPSPPVSATSVSSLATADTGFRQELQQQPSISQHLESTEGFPNSSSQTIPRNDTPGVPPLVTSQATLPHAQTSNSVPVASNAASQLQQFLVSASVVEDVSAAMPHYQDDILKLIVTMPVHGQKQNVQFDFHLVEDDPVEVAREMVTELGIPQEAILEIGGTISALAREARIKQGHHRKHQQATQPVITTSVPIPSTHVNHLSSSMYQSQPPSQVLQPQHAQSIATVAPPLSVTNENPMYQPHQSSKVVQSQHPQNAVPTLENHFANSTNQAQQPSQFVHTQSNTVVTTMPPTTHENHVSNSMFQSQHSVPQPVHGSGNIPLQRAQSNTTVTTMPPTTHENHTPNSIFQSQTSSSQPVHGSVNVSTQRQVASATPPPPTTPLTGQDVVQTNLLTALQPVALDNPVPVLHRANSSTQAFPQSAQQQTDQIILPEINKEAAESSEPITDIQNGSLPNQPRAKIMEKDVSELTFSDPINDPQNTRLINIEGSEGEDDDDNMNEELKRLNADFHKDLMRAEKVHDIRMDNLRRAKLEKEQRHIQTLEKHEKEKMQFEKRVQQEAMEQSKRLEKIQLKYASQRQKLVQKNTEGSSVSSSPTQDISDQNQ